MFLVDVAAEVVMRDIPSDLGSNWPVNNTYR